MKHFPTPGLIDDQAQLARDKQMEASMAGGYFDELYEANCIAGLSGLAD